MPGLRGTHVSSNDSSTQTVTTSTELGSSLDRSGSSRRPASGGNGDAATAAAAVSSGMRVSVLFSAGPMACEQGKQELLAAF